VREGVLGIVGLGIALRVDVGDRISCTCKYRRNSSETNQPTGISTRLVSPFVLMYSL
jgi:hypothetical protein